MTGIFSSNEVGWVLMQSGLSPFTLDTEMFQIVRDGENYIVCKLAEMWAYGTFGNRQKIQNLVFPAGITWNRENLESLTKIENETFRLIRSISNDYKTEEQQKRKNLAIFPW